MDSPRPTFPQYRVLADYTALTTREVNLHEGEVVELVKIGCAGWWYVRLTGEDPNNTSENKVTASASQMLSQTLPHQMRHHHPRLCPSFIPANINVPDTAITDIILSS